MAYANFFFLLKVKWFHLFLSNTNDSIYNDYFLHTVKSFQLLLFKTNN